MLLKNGIVVSGSGCTRQDIRMDEGRILQTGAGLNPLEGEEVMDVSGCLVAPGGIDAHTHFDMPCGSIMFTPRARSATAPTSASTTPS